MKKLKNFKTGATSIYVVVIATLLFSVITVSFITIIVSEANRTTSDELAQAAYDSALAGVEDAKVALKKYYECRTGAGSSDCDVINEAIQASIDSSNADIAADDYAPACDGVARALGRILPSESSEVLIQEDDGVATNTVQAYTCVMLNDILEDYRSTLSSATTVRVVPLRPEAGIDVNEITGVRISWFSQENGELATYTFGNKTSFSSLTDGVPTPPTISAQLIQTTTRYELSDFDSMSDIDFRTDRATIFFTPTDSGDTTHAPLQTVARSNDHKTTNNPIRVRCRTDRADDAFSDVSRNPRITDEFGCTATMEFPAPFGATMTPEGIVNSDSNSGRSAETFFLVLALPYGQPTTDFAVQLCTDRGINGDATRGDCLDKDGNPSIARFSGVQISIDSTGRANDMYSRVEARVEFNDIYYPFPEFALQATGDSDDAIRKNFYVTADCWTRTSSGVNNCDSTGDSMTGGPNAGSAD